MSTAADIIVPLAVLALAVVMVRKAIRSQPPRYRVEKRLDPGWHQVQAVLRDEPDPEVDRYIRESRRGRQ